MSWFGGDLKKLEDQKKGGTPIGTNISFVGGVAGIGKSMYGQQNIAIGYNQVDEKTFTIFTDDSGEWMRWQDKTCKAQIKVSAEWIKLNPEMLADQHPLDFGKVVDVGDKEDLAELQAQYEEHIKQSPWLQKLRRDYDEIVDKHKVFDAIKGAAEDAQD